jgi:hypothetical protein
VLLFDHTSAHEFSQPPTLAAAVRRGEERVPVEMIRAGEYPTLVSRGLHGVPHQSRQEVHECLLTGKPPAKWAHVYTGNASSDAGSLFRPALPPLPALPATPLARVLTGLDDFALTPIATAWLLRHEPRSEAAAAASREQLDLHRRLMLRPMSRALRTRLRRLAKGKEADLLAAGAAGAQAEYAQRCPGLAPPAVNAVANAARVAMADPELRVAKRQRPSSP